MYFIRKTVTPLRFPTRFVVILTATLLLASCGGGGGGDGNDDESGEAGSNQVTLAEIETVLIPARASGESHSVVDINGDGTEELFFYPASTRSSFMPVDNDAQIFSITEDFQIEKHFSTEYPGGQMQPVSVHDQDSLNFTNGPLQTSWTQDSVVADFNGDGNLDVFVSGHGREWPEGFTGDDDSEDFEALLATPGFTDNYPGGKLQIVYGGETPVVEEVTNQRLFWHSARVGDYDGDGDSDIIATNLGSGDTAVVLFNNDGSGGFTEDEPPVAIAESNFDRYIASVVALADLNSDGKDNLIVGPQPSSFFDSAPAGIVIYTYDNGDFSPTPVILAYPDNFSRMGSDYILNTEFLFADKINTGDYDADGDIDILVKLTTADAGFSDPFHDQQGYVGTYIYRNEGNLEFTVVQYETLESYRPSDGGEFFDIDSDGFLDIIHPGWPLDNNDVSDIFEFIYINDGNGSFDRLSDIYEVDFQLPVSPNGENIGLNYEVSYWTFVMINGEPVVLINKVGEWLRDNLLIFARLEFS